MKYVFAEEKKWGKMPTRVLTLISLFLGTFSLVQSIYLAIEYFTKRSENLSALVIVLFLLVTPLTFVAVCFFVKGIHKIHMQKNGDSDLVMGFAFMTLALVDNLIYLTVHFDGDGAYTILALAGIELVCIILYFLYYQGIGNYILVLCGGVLLIVGMGIELIDAIRYLGTCQEILVDDLYYVVKKIVNECVAIQSLLFLFCLKKESK